MSYRKQIVAGLLGLASLGANAAFNNNADANVLGDVDTYVCSACTLGGNTTYTVDFGTLASGLFWHVDFATVSGLSGGTVLNTPANFLIQSQTAPLDSLSSVTGKTPVESVPGTYSYTFASNDDTLATGGLYNVRLDNITPVGATGTLIFQLTAVPEPESYAMMLAGLGAMGFMARRRKSV